MIALFQSLFTPPRHMILLILALWAGLTLAERRAERHSIPKEHLSNLVFYACLAYILGGRLAFVLENLSVFAQSPFDILSLSPSIFDASGAALAALLTSLIYAYRQKLPPWSLLDALTPVFGALAIGLGLSHLAAETAYGKLTGLPWGIEMRGATRHPSQIYETAASLLTFGLIWFKKADARLGALFLTFAALTAAARLFLEALRGDSAFIPGGFRLAQLIAWAALALCFILYEYLQTRQPAK